MRGRHRYRLVFDDLKCELDTLSYAVEHISNFNNKSEREGEIREIVLSLFVKYLNTNTNREDACSVKMISSVRLT